MRLIYDHTHQNMNMRVFSPDLEPLGVLPYRWGAEPVGIALGEVSDAEDTLAITYLGPSDFFAKGD